MVRMAKGSGLRVYLGTLPPMNPSGFRAGVYGWDLVADFNQRLLAIAAAESVTPVDVYTAFGGDYSLVGGDGVHPNESGYQRIADTFLNAIAATLEEQTASPLQRSITTGAFRTR
jgi:lysophospholipase L1-like esterase